MLLSLRGLTKDYGPETRALDGVDLTFHEGEIAVVIGPSGSGKSTLIRCINMLVAPTAGEVIFDGVHLERAAPPLLKEARSKIGMIFQDYNLIGRTNVLKNVLYGRLGQMRFVDSLLGRYPEAVKQEAAALLQRVGLSEQIYKRADELSGGQMQRVGICRALLQHPKLLLADEPIASLDPLSATTVMDQLSAISREKGLSCIINLHQVEFARKYADRIIGLRRGRVVFDGAPAALTEEMVKTIYEGRAPEAPHNVVELPVASSAAPVAGRAVGQ